MDLAPLSQDREETPAGEPAGNGKSCRADLVAAAGQFSWPPAGSYLAVSGQFLVTVVRSHNGRRVNDQPESDDSCLECLPRPDSWQTAQADSSLSDRQLACLASLDP